MKALVIVIVAGLLPAVSSAESPAESGISQTKQQTNRARAYALGARHDVRLGIAAFVSLLVALWRAHGRAYLEGRKARYLLPWITAVIAYIAAVTHQLISPATWDWETFIVQGLVTSAEAMALWSLALKHALRPKPEEPAGGVST